MAVDTTLPLHRKASRQRRLELESIVTEQRAHAEKNELVNGHGSVQHADRLFAALVIAETIRDGFALLAKAIRPSVEGSDDY